ncbi:hypothetical protein H0H81_009328, partial [Sphagnurus paluster]
GPVDDLDDYDTDDPLGEDTDCDSDNDSESKGKTRASRSIQHLSSAAKRTIKVAYEYLKKTILVEDPFPSTDESQDKSADVMDDPSYQLALQAWSDAAEKLDNELIDPTLEIIQCV